MTEYRYQGVKITTTQTASGRWNASSGYGYADADSEQAAIAALKPKIRAATGAESNRNAEQAAKQQAYAARQKRYRVRFSDGTTVTVEASSAQQAKTRARNERFGRKRDVFGPEPRPIETEKV